MKKWEDRRVFSGSCPGGGEKRGSQAFGGVHLWRSLQVKLSGMTADRSAEREVLPPGEASFLSLLSFMIRWIECCASEVMLMDGVPR